jgi:DNA-binding NtrC family response regulator
MDASGTINLLFIDDDAGYVAVAQHLLSRYQGTRFNLIWKRDGGSALEYLSQQHPVDMLVVDYFLPGPNGLEITREVRSRGILTPIILLTSHRDFRLAIEVLKFGVEDYIIKDDAVDSLLPRTILSILERVALKRQIAEQHRADLIARKRTQAIKELVVTVCHEFNNPLAAIKISTDILLRNQLPKEERVIVEELDRNITKVEKEISRLRDLNFERIDFHSI